MHAFHFFFRRFARFLKLRPALAVSFGLLCLLTSPRPAMAQEEDLEQDVQIRVGGAVRKKFGKDWMVQLAPQLRTDGFNPDRYLLELEGGYEPIKYIDFRAVFRGDIEEKGSDLDHGYRPGASVSGSLPLDDFKPSLRLLYTYDFGPERDTRHRLRYRAKVDYDVPKIRLEVSLGAEAFHSLDDRGVYKMRYSLGLDYKFMKSKKLDQFISVGYMLDYFLDRARNIHIPEIGYKAVFD